MGDSYDIVKQCLLRWLAPLGAWAAHPMFTEAVSGQDADAFSRLLGVPLLSCEVLGQKTDRAAYFAPARACPDHVFLDPDTGIRFASTGAKAAPAYLLRPELVAITEARPSRLTLIFDQSMARGKEAPQLGGKLAALADHGLSSIAYLSHASFVLVGRDRGLVGRALKLLWRTSSLPAGRFLKGPSVDDGILPDNRP